MAFSSLLEIVQRATDDLGLPRPSLVALSNDLQVRQLFAAANAAGYALMRAHDWGALQTLGTITTANGTADYNLASDYDRMIADTTWDRTSTWQMAGPDSVQLNRALREGIVSVGGRNRFRLTGTSINITPTPTAVETLVYEYVSKKWARTAAAAALSEFASDTDTTVFDPELMKAEIKWRFMSAKGMYSDALKDDAMDIRTLRIAGDVGGTVLQMTPTVPRDMISLDNIQDGSWPL